MKIELFPFQKKALANIRIKTAEAVMSYQRTNSPQVVSVTAPTGAGKTIIMASLIESILYGDDYYPEQPDAIIVWLSDSPQLNEQSKLKIEAKADKIRLSQCITINDSSFDRETFEDGQIYFLNTQKLSTSSNLTKLGDGRTFTIWQTFSNTIREKGNRLYLIIDEAHRGMHGRDARTATSIMQKFIKGSEKDAIPPLPVVIGMSATTQRFNDLVQDTPSTIHKCVVTADEVRSSGLLKDRIVITYPEEKSKNDMAILQAAADDWKEKWEHWKQYCYEQHYAYVNPIFIIQVLNGSSAKLTDTDLDDCLRKIEERVGIKFLPGQVVHTFGQTNASIRVNGLDVLYEEPSRIADNKDIRIVFFKENLSTGWDCPRAETMMSFKHANDATYIAQLLGRMVRTPMQMHIEVDDVLNDVHLYLPYFNKDTVKDVVDALQNNEGGEIPTEIVGRSLNEDSYDTWTIKSEKPKQSEHIDTTPTTTSIEVPSTRTGKTNASTSAVESTQGPKHASNIEKSITLPKSFKEPSNKTNIGGPYKLEPSLNPFQPEKYHKFESPFNREEIVRFINSDLCLPTFRVRSVRINDYLKSLFKLAHLLTMSNLYKTAIRDVQSEIIDQINSYIDTLKVSNQYDDLVLKVKQFKLTSQIFDAFGISVDNYLEHDLLSSTDTDIDRQFNMAEKKLYNEGVANAYVNQHLGELEINIAKIDVILFVENKECLNKLHEYAENRFHKLNDQYRKYIAKQSERIRKQYDSIVSDSNTLSKHNFRIPETIQVPHEASGSEYSNHLFVDPKTGTAKISLNGWESALIQEEQIQKDFVCWIRNRERASWALCIPYRINNEIRSMYPDFIIVRKDPITGYVVDILEPHCADLKDNLAKAKGFACYAQKNPEVARIQLIRLVNDPSGAPRLKRLDLTQGAVRNKVLDAINNEELDHIFNTDGFYIR